MERCKLITVLLLLGSIVESIYSRCSGGRPDVPLSMYMIFDDEDESATSENIANVFSLGVAIEARAVPILVHWNILNAFLTRAYDSRFSHKNKENIRLSTIDFPLDRWKIIHHKDNPLFLLIPDALYCNVTGAYKVGLKNVEVTLAPLSLHGAERTNVADHRDLMNWVNAQQFHLKDMPIAVDHIKQYFFDVDTILSILSPSVKTDAFENWTATFQKEEVVPMAQALRTDLPTWNIIITGHGQRGTSIAGVGGEILQSFLQYFTTINTSLLILESCYTGGENKNAIIDFTKNNHDAFKLVNYPIGIVGLQEAGVKVNDSVESFRRYIDFITERAGPNWLTAAISDSSFYSGRFDPGRLTQLYLPNGGFFTLPRAVRTKFLEGDAPGQDVQDFFSEVFVLGNVLNKRHALKTQFDKAQLKRLEQLEKQGPLTTAEEQLKAMLLKSSNDTHLTIDVMQTKALVVTAPHIQMPLRFTNFNYNVPFAPPFVPLSNGTHQQGFLLDNITVNGPLFAFLENAFFMPVGRINKVNFMVKRLVGKNDFRNIVIDFANNNVKQIFIEEIRKGHHRRDLVLEEVVIRANMIEHSKGKDEVEVQMAFKHKDRYWLFTLLNGDSMIDGAELRVENFVNTPWRLELIEPQAWNEKHGSDEQLLKILNSQSGDIFEDR